MLTCFLVKNLELNESGSVCVYRHMLTHTDVKPHECSKCGATFKHHKSLEIHAITHQKVKPYRCKECHRGFSQKVKLDAKSVLVKLYAYTIVQCNRDLSYGGSRFIIGIF